MSSGENSLIGVLRQLTPDERRRVAQHCGCRQDALPEEVLRTLSRLSGVYTFGIFPASTPEALLDQLGRRLGMPPLQQGVRPLAIRERAIFGYYFRQAWEAASPMQRREVLRWAHNAWDNPHAPRPELPDGSLMEFGLGEDVERLRWQAVLDAMLQQSAGCRSLAQAVEHTPLPLPVPGADGRFVPRMSARGPGHAALFGVLCVLWQSRARLLRDRRTQRSELERQVRQTGTLLAARKKSMGAESRPWQWRPHSGLALSAAGVASVVLHVGLGAASVATVVPAVIAGGVGLAWVGVASARGPRPEDDRRVAKVSDQVKVLRDRLSLLDREIVDLEAD